MDLCCVNSDEDGLSFNFSMTTTTTILQQFDKGLRSLWISEQLATVSKLNRLFEENPVPTFVNSMLVRLAEAFKDGSNGLRVGIARSLSQCGSHLTLAFSSNEIFRRIIVVSHSNDPNARECVLDVLASLAPISPENSQVHHLICESLTAENEGEFRAACHAMRAFAQLSSHFSETIVLQVGKLLEEQTIKEAQKIQLCGVFATMCADANTVDKIFSITEVVFTRDWSDKFLSAYLSSTTSLCIEVKYAIPRQIEILLKYLKIEDTIDKKITTVVERRISTRKICIVLQQLRRLAQYSTIWTDEQVMKFCAFLTPMLPKVVIRHFFEVTIELSKASLLSKLDSLKKLAISCMTYGSVEDPRLSIRYVQFAVNVFCLPNVFVGENADDINVTLTSLSVIIGSICTKMDVTEIDAKKLYRSIGSLLCTFPYNQFEFSKVLLSSILTTFSNDPRSYPKQRLELLCRLVDSNTCYVLDIQQWASEIVKNNEQLFREYPNLFAFLCFTIDTGANVTVPGDMFNSDVLRYETARLAFRNGRWKDIALPILKNINVNNLSRTEADWILALTELAESGVNSFTKDELEKQQRHLRSAASILNSAKFGTKLSSEFYFPIQMIERMSQTSEVLSHIQSIVHPFLTDLSGALKPGKFFNPITAKRFTVALNSVEPTVVEVQQAWSVLSCSSFCADETSLDLINLYHSRMTLLLIAVHVVLGKHSPEAIIHLPPLNNSRTTTQFQKEKLQWVIDQIPLLKYQELPNLYTISCFNTIVEQLAIIPYMLPRFFFYRFYNVEFKITTTPQAENNRSYLSGETIPVRVDGVVSSNHPSAIRSIIVIAEVLFSNNSMRNHVLTETVEPNEKNYFSAQFLMQLKWSCEINFRIEFIDSKSRKQWKSSTSTVLPMMIREVSKAARGLT